MKAFFPSLIVMLLLMMNVPQVGAQVLVNSNFESTCGFNVAPFGWTATNVGTGGLVDCNFFPTGIWPSPSPAGGNFERFQDGTIETIDQNITGLTIGSLYQVSFYIYGGTVSSSDLFRMIVNGTTIASSGGVGANWVLITGTFISTATTVPLTLEWSLPGSLITPNFDAAVDGPVTAVTLLSGLPVTVTGFDYDCEKDSETINLSWEVEHEVDGDHYEVWVSADGTTYSKEGEVACKGLSTYHFPMNKRNGTTYVQLSLIDVDGIISYFNQFNIDCELGQVEVYPNPASDNVSIVAPSTYRMSHIELNDMLENSVLNLEHDFSKMKTLQLNVSDFAAGVYMLKVVSITGKTAYIQLMID